MSKHGCRSISKNNSSPIQKVNISDISKVSSILIIREKTNTILEDSRETQYFLQMVKIKL